MIITDKFVVLNLPKTGSSFVRTVIKKIHKYDTLPSRVLRRFDLVHNPSMIELILPVVDKKISYGLRGQHGTYRQIPQEHKHKTIVSVVRNPFDRYVSGYLFGWWRRYPPVNRARLQATFPHFPSLSFGEYYEMNSLFGVDNRVQGIHPRIELGFYTVQFIQFFFKEPEKVLGVIDNCYIEQRMYLADMADVVFLHQENLNQELYEFLSSVGYPQKDIRFVIDAERVNTTPRETNQLKLEDFYTRELVEDVLGRDRLLFELFPEYREYVDIEESGEIVFPERVPMRDF